MVQEPVGLGERDASPDAFCERARESWQIKISKYQARMPKKQANPVSPVPEGDEGTSSEEETIDVQVQNARKRKAAPALKERGKAIQAKGVEARKKAGAASAREREVERLSKKNDHLERMSKIDQLEAAERERAEALQKTLDEKKKGKQKVNVAGEHEVNLRLAKLEELMTARAAEKEEMKKPKRTKKAPPKRSQDAEPDESASSDDDEEPPRQRAVRKSAKSELKRRAGAEEEQLHGRSNPISNRNKGKAVELEHQQRMRALAQNIMPMWQ